MTRYHTHSLWSWDIETSTWASVDEGSQAAMSGSLQIAYHAAMRANRIGAAFAVARIVEPPTADPKTLGVPVVADTFKLTTRDVGPNGKARPAWRYADYRAGDLTPGDVILHGHMNKLVLHIFTEDEPPTDEVRDLLGRLVSEAVDDAFTGSNGYRVVLVATSDKLRIYDVIPTDSFALISTQVQA